MRMFRSFPELLNVLQATMLTQDPHVRIVEMLGDWIFAHRSFDEVLAIIEGSYATGDQAAFIRPMSHSDSVDAVNKQRQLWSATRRMSTPRFAFSASRLPRARAHRGGRAHRAGRTHKAAAVRTGPPGSSEDGDPEPGEAGPHSHRLEKLETAKTRQRGSHV